jgi:hypothetical protein
MEELLFTIAKHMPIEVLLSSLKKAIIKHEDTPTEDTLDEVSKFTILYVTKMKIGENSVEDTVQSFKAMDEAMEIGKRITGQDKTS